MLPENIEQIEKLLLEKGYIADRQLAIAFLLGYKLKKPLLIEGPPGVGKTELAKTAASIFNTNLIRLQCYEGLEASQALYEWNHPKQLIRIKIEEGGNKKADEIEHNIYSEEFLLKRPLLQSIQSPKMPVLLIDELDRSDEEFESFLLEILSDWQITIPEYGTIKPTHIPFTIITGNRTRELSDALRRRCFYVWLDYPDIEKESNILLTRVPEIDKELADTISKLIAEIRELKILKKPGTAEAIDWARTISTLHYDKLDPDLIKDTLGIILKDNNDITQVGLSLADFIEKLGISTRLAPQHPKSEE